MDKRLFEEAEKQINSEFYNSYLYLSMSLWADANDWPGLANWMRIQSQEEWVHGTTLINQLQQRGESPTLTAIASPEVEWADPLAIMEATLEAEQGTTAAINNLADMSMNVKDHAFYEFMMMYVKEQIEEEEAPTKYIKLLNRIKDNAGAMYQFDKELAGRFFTPPFPQAQG